MSGEKTSRTTTTTKSYKKSVLLTSLSRDEEEPPLSNLTDRPSGRSNLPIATLALPPPESPQVYYSVLKLPFIGRAPLKTVCVPRAIVEPEPPTVKTAKTVLCSYKVTN